jgi:predicted Zn-dependent protease
VSPSGEAAPAPAAPSTLAAQPAFRLEKAPILLSASSALTPRGESAEDRQRFLAALGDALAPYRADDFAEAATRLSRLSQTYPDKVEPALYAGVSYLLSNRAFDAVTLLERARAHAPAELIDEVEWRLALAHVHAGVPERAREPLTRLCGTTDQYQTLACDGVRLVAR